MEERYSRTVRQGDAYVSIRQILDSQLVINVGIWFEDDVSKECRDQEIRIRPATMDLLIKVYSEWREQSGRGIETSQELPEKTD